MGRYEEFLTCVAEGLLDYIGEEEGKGYLPQKYLNSRAFVEICPNNIVKIHHKTTKKNSYNCHTVQIWKGREEALC